MSIHRQQMVVFITSSSSLNSLRGQQIVASRGPLTMEVTSSIQSIGKVWFLTAILHRGLRNCFPLFPFIYFLYSIWTFISLFNLNLYFSIFFSIFFRFFYCFPLFFILSWSHFGFLPNFLFVICQFPFFLRNLLSKIEINCYFHFPIGL